MVSSDPRRSHRKRNRQWLAVHAARLRRAFTLHRWSVAVEMWI